MTMMIPQQLKSKPIKRYRNNNHYDRIYNAIQSMLSKDNIPTTLWRISNNKTLLLTLLETELIIKNKNKDLELTSYHREECDHYIVSSKGMDYMKKYEALRELFL